MEREVVRPAKDITIGATVGSAIERSDWWGYRFIYCPSPGTVAGALTSIELGQAFGAAIDGIGGVVGGDCA